MNQHRLVDVGCQILTPNRSNICELTISTLFEMYRILLGIKIQERKFKQNFLIFLFIHAFSGFPGFKDFGSTTLAKNSLCLEFAFLSRLINFRDFNVIVLYGFPIGLIFKP
jgi:hypothetical protein